MKLISSAFQPGGAIPPRFTCEGDNISPQLSWTGAPKEAKSFVLIMHDPDAPRRGGFTHWVLYNIPANVASLDENVTRQPDIDGVGRQGKNDSGSIGYMGPCPPSGTHRYFFWLYSLRAALDLQPGATYEQVKSAIEAVVIEQTELMGTYAKGAAKAA